MQAGPVFRVVYFVLWCVRPVDYHPSCHPPSPTAFVADCGRLFGCCFSFPCCEVLQQLGGSAALIGQDGNVEGPFPGRLHRLLDGGDEVIVWTSSIRRNNLNVLLRTCGRLAAEPEPLPAKTAGSPLGERSARLWPGSHVGMAPGGSSDYEKNFSLIFLVISAKQISTQIKQTVLIKVPIYCVAVVVASRGHPSRLSGLGRDWLDAAARNKWSSDFSGRKYLPKVVKVKLKETWGRSTSHSPSGILLHRVHTRQGATLSGAVRCAMGIKLDLPES